MISRIFVPLCPFEFLRACLVANYLLKMSKSAQKLSKIVKIFQKRAGSCQSLSKKYKNGLFVFIYPGDGKATWFRLKKRSQLPAFGRKSEARSPKSEKDIGSREHDYAKQSQLKDRSQKAGGRRQEAESAQTS